MARVLITTLALTFATLSPVLAKDLCIQIDTGGEAGGRIDLKKVKLGKGQFGPVHGYHARFDQPTLSYRRFFPVEGQAISASNGNLVIGLAWYEVDHNANGSFNVLNDVLAFNIGCAAGADGKIGVLDACDLFLFGGIGQGQSADGHIVPCKEFRPVVP